MSTERNQDFWRAVNPHINAWFDTEYKPDDDGYHKVPAEPRLRAAKYHAVVDYYNYSGLSAEFSQAIVDALIEDGFTIWHTISGNDSDDAKLVLTRPQATFNSKAEAYEKSHQVSLAKSLNDQWAELPLGNRLFNLYVSRGEMFDMYTYHDNVTYYGSVKDDGKRFVFYAEDKPTIIIMLDGDKFYSDDIDRFSLDHFRDAIVEWSCYVWNTLTTQQKMIAITCVKNVISNGVTDDSAA